jgi:hypothetical protein
MENNMLKEGVSFLPLLVLYTNRLLHLSAGEQEFLFIDIGIAESYDYEHVLSHLD